MKNKILLIAATSLFCFNAYANSPAPSKCPSMSAVESAGLTYARKVTLTDNKEHWVAFQPRSSFDTEQEWGFFIGPLDGSNDETSALKNGTTYLASMQLINGPFETEDGSGEWLCFYGNSSQVYAFAGTPPEQFDFPTFSKRFIK